MPARFTAGPTESEEGGGGRTPIESQSFGGITRAELNLVAAKLNVNKVKLPTPSASDYVTPSAVAVSSEPDDIVDDFETDPSTDMNDWTYTEVDTNNVIALARQSAYVKHGSYGWGIPQLGGSGGSAGDYAQISKTFDLTNRSKLKVHLHANTWGYERVKAEIFIAGESKYSVQTGNFDVEASIDVSPYSGNQTVAIRYTDIASNIWAAHWDYLRLESGFLSTSTKDESLTTSWRPSPPNEANAWCRWDMGALKICSGCRIYWGADENYRPSSYKIQVSENATDWTDVYDSGGAKPPAGGWVEYSWNARYARYIRYLNTHATGENQEIYEMDYYSRITDRVAAEHGHGSGVTPYLHGHGVRKGFTVRDKLKAKPTLTPEEIVDYIDFMLGE